MKNVSSKQFHVAFAAGRLLFRKLMPSAAAILCAFVLCPQSGLSFDGGTLWSSIELAQEVSPRTVENGEIASDGNGGAIVVWTDVLDLNPSTYSAMLVAQRLDYNGDKLWGGSGLYVSDRATSHSPAIAADGAGGVLAAWWTGQSSGSGVYAQRLNASGVRQWGTLDVQVGSSVDDPSIASDGIGGAFVGWSDRLARVQPNGTLDAPGINGIELIPGPELITYKMIADGKESVWPTVTPGGVFAAWSTSSGQLVAQRVNAGLRWGTSGLVVATHGAIVGYDLTLDGAGGIILCWVATDGAYPYRYTVRAQRLDVNGNPLWSSGGVVIIDSDVVSGNYNQPYYSAPALTGDGSGGAIVAWLDSRNWGSATPPGSSGNWNDLYAQRVGNNGTLQWNNLGVLLPPYITNMVNDVAPGNQGEPRLVSDTLGGAVVAYDDDGGWNWDIAGTRLNNGGTKLWSKWIFADGSGSSNPGLTQNQVQIAFDASGPAPKGAVVVWRESDGGYHRIYAEKVEVDVLPPNNDGCAGAIALSETVYHVQRTANATDDGVSTCLSRTMGKGVWFTFTPVFSGKATVDTCPSDFDTMLDVFTGGCAGLNSIVCNDDSTACGSLRSSLSFPCTTGTTYFINASGFGGQSGNLEVRVRNPVLQWERAAGNSLNLWWVTGYVLQSSLTPTGAWTDVTTGVNTNSPLSTYSTSMSGASLFFRLR